MSKTLFIDGDRKDFINFIAQQNISITIKNIIT